MWRPAEFAVFERYIYQTVRKNFPKKDGWKIETKPIRGFRRKETWYPDYVAYRGHERAVIDAKCRRLLTRYDIEKILQDKGQYKAQRTIIYIASNTEVPSAIKEFARDYGVEIRRTWWRIRKRGKTTF